MIVPCKYIVQYSILSVYVRYHEHMDNIFSIQSPSLQDLFGSVRIPVVILGLALAVIFGMQIITWMSARHARRLDRHDDASMSGVIRLRRYDTRARVLAAVARASLLLVVVVVGLHLILPDSASALWGTALVAALMGFALQPVIRDSAAGSIMMAEQWFHVGDRIHVQPQDISGVVEHFNLRSTQMRTLSGERVIVHNSAVDSVSVARRGVRHMTLEIVVRDAERGRVLIDHASRMLPTGAEQLVRGLTMTDCQSLGDDPTGGVELHRITASATVASGRAWILEDFAPKLLHEVDRQLWEDEVIMHGPLVYDTDSIAQSRLLQSVRPAQLSL